MQVARAEALQGRVPRTFRLAPVQDWLYPAGGWCEQHEADFCREAGHEGICVRWWSAWWHFYPSVGRFRLKAPINIRQAMPGSGHVITFAKLRAMIVRGWWVWVIANDRSFTIYADESVAFRAEGAKVAQGENSWAENNYIMNVDISRNERLDVELWACLRVVTGEATSHLADVSITIEYVPEVPPEPATVRVYVYNRQTGRAVGGALVQLLSGSKVVAQGYTRGDGTVAFSNVPAGEEGVSYTLRVAKSGFEVYEEAVEVRPGENSFAVGLVPIPPPPAPEWLKYAVVGGLALVGGGVAMAAMRRERERVVVVR